MEFEIFPCWLSDPDFTAANPCRRRHRDRHQSGEEIQFALSSDPKKRSETTSQMKNINNNKGAQRSQCFSFLFFFVLVIRFFFFLTFFFCAFISLLYTFSTISFFFIPTLALFFFPHDLFSNLVSVFVRPSNINIPLSFGLTLLKKVTRFSHHFVHIPVSSFLHRHSYGSMHVKKQNIPPTLSTLPVTDNTIHITTHPH